MNALLLFALVASSVRAHVGPYTKGNYCQNGLSNTYAPATAESVWPLFKLPKSQWWMHGKCANFPPPEGDFLELPAGGTTTIELANNKAYTTMGYPWKVTAWPDGINHTELDNDTVRNRKSGPCITKPNLHAFSKLDASGTVLAIAYESDIKKVTELSQLTVFSVAGNTPWKRLTTYEIPAQMPACPPGGCVCVWGWIPNGCGVYNMFMVPIQCQVTNVRSDAKALAKPQVPVWCDEDPSKCVKGAKQFIAYNQLEGNNFNYTEQHILQSDRSWRKPCYNTKMGFHPGPQNDIFVDHATSNSTSSTAATATAAVNPKTVTKTAYKTKYKTKTVTVTKATSTAGCRRDEDGEDADDDSAPQSEPVPSVGRHARAHRRSRWFSF